VRSIAAFLRLEHEVRVEPILELLDARNIVGSATLLMVRHCDEEP
jgi:hypothetical protein